MRTLICVGIIFVFRTIIIDGRPQGVNNDVDSSSVTSCSDQPGYICVPQSTCQDTLADATDIRQSSGDTDKEYLDDSELCTSGGRDKRQTGEEQVCCKESTIITPGNNEECINQENVNEGVVVSCGKHNICGSEDKSNECSNSEEENSAGQFQSKFGEWPHMCAVFRFRGDKQEYLCGASLITPGILLTAAHWVNDFLDFPQILSVRCGDHKRPFQETGKNPSDPQEPQPHQDRRVAEIAIHPSFWNHPSRVWNDVGLLFVDSEFKLADHINPICLPTLPNDRETEYSHNNCIATGWGRERHDGEFASTLKKIELPIINNRQCEEMFMNTTRLGTQFKLHKSMICAGGEHGEDTCNGDGGGPLVCPSVKDPNSFIQAGITSWGIGCGNTDVPGVYASVSTSLCFIDSATKCVHGDRYNEYYNIEECQNWMEEETNRLNRLKTKIEQLLAGPNLEQERKELYEPFLQDVKKFQYNAREMKRKCDAREMKLCFNSIVSNTDIFGNSNAVVRVSGLSAEDEEETEDILK